MKSTKFPSDIKISLIYATLGAIWILYSDKVMRAFVQDNEQIKKIEIYKGFFFIVITGLLLYLLIHAELKRRNKILVDLRDAKKKSEESDRLKSAFLANISHYLRTPMNSILGFVDLLQNRNLDKNKQEKFQLVINEQSNHLLQFINNIIEISQLQGGQTEVKVKEFSINDLIRKLQIRYQTELEFMKKKDLVNLKGFYQINDFIIKNDPEKIEYILTNLLSNAIKFTKTGEINFGYNIQHKSVIFFVKDTGCGIAPEKQELIIKTFMLSDPDVNQENIGFGLGLAITSGLVKLLRGNLWLQKSDSSGTEFRFDVPADYNSL